MGQSIPNVFRDEVLCKDLLIVFECITDTERVERIGIHVNHYFFLSVDVALNE